MFRFAQFITTTFTLTDVAKQNITKITFFFSDQEIVISV